MSESIDHSWICREDFGIERNQSFKENQGNAQFSLCCTSTAMPDDESQESTSGILFLNWGTRRRPVEAAVSAANVHTLFLNPGNMSCGKLPATIAFDQRVGELHDSIKCFAVRCSFHARFANDNS
jgi:hypothetical protein